MAVWSKPLLRRRRKRPEHVGLLRAYVKAVADGCLAMLALEAVARWPAQAGWPTIPTPTSFEIWPQTLILDKVIIYF